MEYKALKDIATITMGQSPESSSYNSIKDGLPFFQGNADFGEKYPNEKVWCNNPKKLAEPGDILISVRAPIGAVNYAKNRCCIGRGLAAISIEDEIERNFVFHLLKARNSELNQQGTGSTFKAIGKSVLENLQVPQIAPIELKKCINMMGLLEAAIRKRKKQLELLDELVKARFVEMFELDDCKWGSFGENTDFVDYRGHTPELSGNGTIRMINAKSVGKGVFKYIEEYVTDEVYNSWMHRGFGYPGDVLFVTEGHTFGNTCRVPNELKKFALGQRVITIKAHEENLNNAFLCAYMQTDRFWNDINVYRTGGTAQGIRSKDLIKVKLPLAPLEDQQKYAAFVDQVDKTKDTVQKSLDETQMLFDSLMQQYFG